MNLLTNDSKSLLVFKYKVAKRIIDEEQGRKRRWVSSKINITPESLGRALLGHYRLSRDTTLRLANVLAVPTDVLWTEEQKAS